MTFDLGDDPWGNEPAPEEYWDQPGYADPDPDPGGAESVFAGALTAVAGWVGFKAVRDKRRKGQPAPPAAAAPRPKVIAEAKRSRADVAQPVAADIAEGSDAAPPVPAEAELPDFAAERDALVALCVELDDLLRSTALREKIRRGLRRAGVEIVEPVGDRFDPDRHVAVGAEPASTPEQHDVIAHVQRAGFRDREAELRPPEVVVRHWDGER